MSRPIPRMGTSSYLTFAARTPLSTHSRKATCAEVNCKSFQEGWTIPLTGLDPELEHIARHSGRTFREVDGNNYGLGNGRYLVFAPGQPCFVSEKHRINLDRAAFYFVGRGDYRSFSTRRATQRSEADWLDQFANHQQMLREAQERG